MNEPFTLMLVGTDVRTATNKNWRSDVIMIAAVNPAKKSIKVVSIPRDTLTEIANTEGLQTKINAAPYYGRQADIDPMTNLAETVENFINIPIDYYMKINFKGFMDLVDAVGGIEVKVPFDFNMKLFYKWYTFKKGPTHMNGHEALAYVRMRKSDPRGDLGRNERQREAVQALMKKVVSLDSVTKTDDILKAVGQNINHNIKMKEMLALENLYRQIPSGRIEMVKIRGENSNQNSQHLWYYLVNDQERKRVSRILRKQLDLSSSTASP
ncbi:LCP family protein [Salinithrix halophila]